MYFKSIFLQGFKSFADKTLLEFNGGITAVVGPNGSGKSNISDAIRWVMGETSAKTLRGGSMQDVIFCGSEKRKPLGFAEVTITMDNSDHSMNIDFDEVSITRRVYRSGESEYLINKAPCRLKDIHELFMDTGLGRDGYSIIGQGKIDAILSAKSEERRHIFDEAAGITKYRYRKNEAEKKLSQTDENLTRITDIVSELEGRVEPLRRQSEKALKFLSLRDRRKSLEVNLWLHTIDENKAELEKTDSDYKTVCTQIDTLHKEIDKNELEINAVKDKIRLIENDADKTKAQMYSKRDEITQAGGEVDVLKANVNYNTQNIYRLEGETESLSSRVRELESANFEVKASLTQLNAELATKNDDILIKSAELEKVKAQLNENLGSERDVSQKLGALNDEISEIKIKAAANEQFILSADEQLQRTEAEISALEEKFSAEKFAMDDVNAKISEYESAINEKKQETEKAQAELLKCRSEIEALSKRLSSKQADNRTNLNRKKILEELENDFEGYSKPVKAVMNEHKFGSLRQNKIYGPVSNLIKTEPKYITAIETSLAAAMNNIVTESEDDAKAAINYLKASKKGRVTFLPVSSVKTKPFIPVGENKCKGYIGIASELVSCDGKFSGVLSFLLGRTVVVDSMENAVAMAKQFKYSFKIATLDGEILNVGGSIAGGSSSMGAASGLSRRNDIKELEVLISKTEEEIANDTKKLAALEKSLDGLSARAGESRDDYYAAERRLAEYKTSASHIINAYNENMAVTDEAKKRLSKLASEKAQAAELKGVFENAIEDKNAQYDALFSSQGKTGEMTKELQLKVAEYTEFISGLNISKSSLLKDIEISNEKISSSDAEMKSLSEQISAKAKEREALSAEIKESEAKIEALNELLNNSHNIINGFKEKIEAFEAKKAENETELSKLEASLKETNSTIFRLQDEQGRLSAKKAKFDAERDNVIAKLWEEYELTYSAACEIRSPIENISAAKQELSELKVQIKALGNINLNAVEDYKETKERYEFLSAQQQDIIKAKEELLKLISEMTGVMTEMFDKNFKVLNTKFSETFRSLFGGGYAKLSLADPENILDSGVEIEVQPPGKNLQSITLLSGGEKAFTAIALIFAILKTNPTQFCIFDEIEAALDDANVYRYAEFLKDFAKKTQFIIITHRKGTMEAADTLYGVTMQEKGVTRLLSLDLKGLE